MTLIVSFATPKYTLQVVDARITQGPKVLTDFSAKLVFVEKQMSFSFTGLADINGENSIDWFTKKWHGLKATHFDSACAAIAKLATNEFRRIPYPDKRIIFVGCGWIPIQGKGPRSAIVYIHNCMNENHTFGPLEETFRVQYKLNEKDNLLSFSFTGVALKPELRKKIMTPILRFMERSWSPIFISDELSRGIRMASDHHPHLIGKNTLACYIPKASALDESEEFHFHGEFEHTEKACYYFWGLDKTDSRILGPNIVWKRLIIFQKMYRILDAFAAKSSVQRQQWKSSSKNFGLGAL